MFVDLSTLVGKSILRFLTFTGKLVRFTFYSFGLILVPPFRLNQYCNVAISVGVRSLPIANLSALFVGMVMVLNTGYQLQKFGAKIYSAGIAAIALSREMIPVFTAVVVGSRVAASIAAELGTMRVTEQIDAMDSLAVNPVKYLVVPRILACIFMLPVLTIYSDLVGFVGGLFVGATSLNIPPMLYFKHTVNFLTLNDLYSGIFKTFFFGAIIGIVGCFCGFETRGGAEGVGKSTTLAVVLTLILILISDYLLTTWILTFTGLMA